MSNDDLKSNKSNTLKSKNKKQNIKPKKHFAIQWLILLMLIFITSLTYAVYIIFIPNFNHIPIYSYFNYINEDEINFVVEDNFIDFDTKPVLKEDILYIPIDFIKEFIDEYIFWDKEEQKVIITTTDEVIRMGIQDLNYLINNRPSTLSLPIYNIEDIAYMPYNLLEELYNVSIIHHEDTNIVTVDNTDKSLTSGLIGRKKANIRYEPHIKSPIMYSSNIDDTLTIYEEENKFSKVRLSNGLIGYIKTNNIKDINTLPAQPAKPQINYSTLNYKIVLLWDQMTNYNANSDRSRRQTHPGLNVLSPTWFKFNLNTLNGDIISIADKSYVDWAHQNGIQVWALIDDFPNNSGINVGHEILTSTEKREHAILQLLSSISSYNLDGINIDFEYIELKDAEYYLQFLRELYPLMRERGAILSVDMYVPRPWTSHYNRSEVAKTSDYIAVMTYDEYYAGSTVSGPVASIKFVEDGIKDTLLEVPKEKLLLGLPFYIRTWREEVIDGEVLAARHRDLSMQGAYNLFTQNGAEFIWLDDSGYHYGEYYTVENGNDVTYRVWLEDEESMQLKVDLAEQYDLAGVAGWKRGLELPYVWDIIYNYAENSKNN